MQGTRDRIAGDDRTLQGKSLDQRQPRRNPSASAARRGADHRHAPKPSGYADLLDDVGAGRLTPDEAETISAIVAKRAELSAPSSWRAEIEALKAQLAVVVGARDRPRRSVARSRSPDRTGPSSPPRPPAKGKKAAAQDRQNQGGGSRGPCPSEVRDPPEIRKRLAAE